MKTSISVSVVHLGKKNWTDILGMQILAMASILSITSAAPSSAGAAAQKSTGFIIAYDVADCLDTDDARQLDLPEGECVKINAPSFLSFRGRLHQPLLSSSAQMLKHTVGGNRVRCPTGQEGTLSAFERADCTGESIGIPKLFGQGTSSNCLNSVFVPSLDSGGGKGLAAQSAKFTCVKS